jgi:hypothetical protein
MAAININPMRLVQLTVRLPRSLPWRLWIASKLIGLAAWVLGAGIKVER